MNKINFGRINNFILFGGSKLLLNLARYLTDSKFSVTVVTAKRDLEENIDGQSFEKLLLLQKVPFIASSDAGKDKKVLKMISDTTMGFSLGAPWIFKEEFIRRFKGRLLNTHGTRLPQNRGGGGFSWQILRKNRLGFCLIHQIEPGIDTGDIVKYKEFVFPASCVTPGDHFAHFCQENEGFLKEFILQVKKGNDFELIGQLEYLSIYWPRLNTLRHGFIDWSWSLDEIEVFINAFDEPYAGASTFIGGKKVFLKNCFADHNDGSFHPFQTGIVYRKAIDRIFVAAGQGTLAIGRVLSEQGEDITKKIDLGERFFTPGKYIEEAKGFKAVYTPYGLKTK
jgi:methionyl-tRNA formyltransferase